MGPQRCSEQQTLAPKFGEPGQTLASRIFAPKPAFCSRPLLTLKYPRISSPAVGSPAKERRGSAGPSPGLSRACPCRDPPKPLLTRYQTPRMMVPVRTWQQRQQLLE
ncbi:hypothetical protein Anapl_03873 [Anas platyrhynchos]|uniref:Uncharacterized protein n=1 Tax=Anas platyrhynchos TaxID=8839 RepID=R0JGF8_ANAPL|nr:hypothetical protein Anapl_03873 [Anas platyrhynchos]